ncbi:uncharacterized protein FOMMEDRAFT_168992 [Fomitiporia mediterranea MF3/22]|uniref:uncharacterized protein n=1 Tax=Fomitiporia mediterranea (strain MF3/22) TaxID=694068 RepID=UPI00044080C7|nr:uncharacterized protein FOMMEDRAFT_168992 [Fomitiporia mediterranea MF3/22]EJD00728.1 hypothetical protein FOMMEDRAFT_168992 [Fomitiporia mediterranea MF3/22]
MPTISDQEPHSTPSHPNVFKSLAELDDWTSKPRYQTKLEGLLEYTPRSKPDNPSHRNSGKLLVCHDYKGGYSEGPSSLAYTFNFWDLCDTFIYFSHHRVTIPPPGWVNAAHRQGVKILGVLIFEHEQSMEDTLRLFLGKLPNSRTRPPALLIGDGLPVSRYYARILADLAYERGFDGYLLNFEYPLPGRANQTRAIETWVSLLNAELKHKVGGHAQTVWYDSVIVTGDLRWQDRLNSRNVSFFLASDTFFTNYTWPPSFPAISAQYLLGLAPDLFQGSKKTLQDIYIGIDVWGRGCHGGGGFGCFRAAEHIDPAGVGLSIALFGPGWSWENDEGKDGWSWKTWWERERTLWVGPAIEGAHVEVPDAPQRDGEPPCPHGKFRPISDFFQSAPSINPNILPFYTSFCPGVGHGWFVEGRRMMHKNNGWTDIDKQTSLGNLLWPRPRVDWEGTDLNIPLPKTSTILNFDDAFNGGSSVTVRLTGEGGSEEEPSFRCFWIPVQSIALTSGSLYEVELIYKISAIGHEFDLALSVKGKSDVDITPLTSSELESGWNKVSITCKPSGDLEPDTPANVGVILAMASEDGSLPYTIDVQLAQLSITPKATLQNLSPYKTQILWVDCVRDANSADVLLITWDACITYTTPASLRAEDLIPEVPRPPWVLDRSAHWFPRFRYANIYVEARTPATGIRPSGSAIFLGTSGWGSGATTGVGLNGFVIETGTLPNELKESTVRFYVQGVTDRGTILPWESCAFVDFAW